MSKRTAARRPLIVSIMIGLALSLIPLATALADGNGASFPR